MKVHPVIYIRDNSIIEQKFEDKNRRILFDTHASLSDDENSLRKFSPGK